MSSSVLGNAQYVLPDNTQAIVLDSVYEISYLPEDVMYQVWDLNSNRAYLLPPLRFNSLFRHYYRDDALWDRILITLGSLKPVRVVPTRAEAGVQDSKHVSGVEIVALQTSPATLEAIQSIANNDMIFDKQGAIESFERSIMRQM